MIELYRNLLTNEEKAYLKNKCDNFVETHSPFVNGNINRSYHKYKLDETIELLELQNRLLDLIKEKKGSNIEFSGFVINRATDNTNKHDKYHIDNSDFTIVTYLNDDFTGGDFVYSFDNMEHIQIPVEMDLSILMNKTTPHKITPVESGVRFSFACFFDYNSKRKKTFI